MTRYLLVLLVLGFWSCKNAPNTTMDKILANGSSTFNSILNDKDKHEIQILFSPVIRRNDSIIIEDHFYNFRPDDYFYPASTVKMPVAFLALQKIESLQKSGISIDINTSLTIDSLRPPQSAVSRDTTAQNGMPSIGHYIEKVFAVSDNDAYNRLYEFCGQDYINTQMKIKNIFTNSRIVSRVGVGGFSPEENRYTPSMHFYDEKKKEIFTAEETYAQGMHIFPLGKTSKGVGYTDDNGNLIKEPFDFSQKNFINIKDLQESLVRLVFPQNYLKQEVYSISEKKRLFALESMAKMPREHEYLKDNPTYYDSYVKFFLFGDSEEPMPDHIRIHNKVGYAYGYLTDCAYIVDSKEGIEYFLTATIHVNENQIYNDGKYEYDELGIPFLAELGRKVHSYMIDQKKSK